MKMGHIKGMTVYPGIITIHAWPQFGTTSELVGLIGEVHSNYPHEERRNSNLVSKASFLRCHAIFQSERRSW